MTPWTAARQDSLLFTVSQSLLKLMSIESVMPSNRLVLCRPLLLLPSIFPSTRGFSSESVPYTQIMFIVVAQSLSHVKLLMTPWTAAHQASLSLTISQSLLKLMSIELVMSSNHLILCYPLLLLSSIFPNIRVFSNDLAVHIRRPKYWSFSFSISPSNEYSGFKSLLSHTKKKMLWLEK